MSCNFFQERYIEPSLLEPWEKNCMVEHLKHDPDGLDEDEWPMFELTTFDRGRVHEAAVEYHRAVDIVGEHKKTILLREIEERFGAGEFLLRAALHEVLTRSSNY